MSVCEYPTEFPADSAVRLGKAIMSKSFGRANAKDAWCLQGYLQGRLLGDGPAPNPVFGGGVQSDDELGELLVRAGVESEIRNVGAAATEPKALPLLPLLQLIIRMLAVVI